MVYQSPHNLPEQPNALLGRDDELKSAIEQLLSRDVRLLSLTGPPGVGKTRLAMSIAESLLGAFPDGIWFIDLAPLKDPALVASKIASTFEVGVIRDETALDSLAAFLGGRRILLFLDNFERLLPAATWVGKLLEQTSGLKILTTSRERLRLRWERTIHISPLPLPDPHLPSDLPTLARIPSVDLFLQRASAVNENFKLSTENAPIIAELCNHLDGLPLAIELAAAHVSALSPEEILTNLHNRFRLLQMGSMDLPERHQTLKAAIDWSYETLQSGDAQFLRRLAVFSGGFSLTAAESVAEPASLGLDTLQSLISLVEKSLINRSQSTAGGTRFTFLESIQDYLMERLRASGELESTRRRHAMYYLEMAEQSYSNRRKKDQKSRFDLLESEHDNMRSALQWSLDTGELSIGRQIAANLWNPFWWLRGHVPEAIWWLETFRENKGDPEDEIQLQILEGLGMLRGWQGDFEAGKLLLMKALQVAEERGDHEAVIRMITWLSWISWVNGKTEEADWLMEKVKGLSKQLDPFDQAYVFLSVGSLLYEAGRDEDANQAFTRSLQYFEMAEGKQSAISAGSKLALLKHKKGDFYEAKQEMIKALNGARQPVALYVIAYCVDDAVQLAAQHMVQQNVAKFQDLEKLAWILGAVDEWRAIFSLPRTPREKLVYSQVIESLRHRLGDALYLRAWQQGQSIHVGKVIEDTIRLLERAYQTDSTKGQAPEEDRITIELSKREREVIGLVAEGLSNQQIGERLFITERTVRFHLTSIFNKLGAENRTQAVAIANRLGIL